jgi:predicted TPR repeat methyltransferase
MPGRNAFCPCGSGRKFKHCCLRGGEASAHVNRGLLLMGANRNEEAVAAFQQALAIDPRMAHAHNALGVAFKNLGNIAAAQDSYRAALGRDSGYAPAHHNLGEMLFRQGRLTEAKSSFETALAIDPQLHQSRLNLGNLLADLGELDDAIGHYRLLIQANWNLPGAYASLGSALNLAGKPEEALQCFAKAVAISRDSGEAYFNLAKAQLQSGNAQAAVENLNQALRLKPGFPEAKSLLAAAYWCQGEFAKAVVHCREVSVSAESAVQIHYTLGTVLLMCGRHGNALECFQRVLEMEPDHPTAAHFTAALLGTNPDHSAPAYVQQVFDDSAGDFNRHLTASLRYTAPRQLAQLALECATRPVPWDILDLGCGTGLFGAEIAPHSRRLVGIDLSARMLDQARALQLYDRLVQADLLTALDRETAESYDLISAVDVFIYVGKLDGVASQVKTLLRPGGLFAFSAEAMRGDSASSTAGAEADAEEAGYRLSTTGRYVHRAAYLDRLAAKNNFKAKRMSELSLRLENSRAVPGWLVIWEMKPHGST